MDENRQENERKKAVLSEKTKERIRYNKCRQRINVRVSPTLYDLMEDACRDLGVSKQALTMYCLLDFLDHTGQLCPDIARLPAQLR